MMKRTFFIILFLFVTPLSFASSDVGKSWAAKLYNEGPTAARAEIGKIPASEKSDLLRYLQSSEIEIYDNSYKDTLLLELEDRATTEKYVQKWEMSQGFNGWTELRVVAASPVAIMSSSRLIFRVDPFKEIGGDTPRFTLPYTTSVLIAQITAISPKFSLETRMWAKGWTEHIKANSMDAKVLLRVMRKWWNANQQYFYAGNYAAVQPGDPPPGTSPSPTPDTWIGPTPYPPPVATASPVQAVTPAPSASIAPVTRPLLLPVAIGLLALLGAGVALFLRQRK
jgi:hypothetical protein